MVRALAEWVTRIWSTRRLTGVFVSLIDDLIFDTLRGPIRMQSGELISSWPLPATTYQSSHSLLFSSGLIKNSQIKISTTDSCLPLNYPGWYFCRERFRPLFSMPTKSKIICKTTSGAGCSPVIRIDLLNIWTHDIIFYIFLIKLFSHIRDFVCKIFSNLRSGGGEGGCWDHQGTTLQTDVLSQ